MEAVQKFSESPSVRFMRELREKNEAAIAADIQRRIAAGETNVLSEAECWKMSCSHAGLAVCVYRPAELQERMRRNPNRSMQRHVAELVVAMGRFHAQHRIDWYPPVPHRTPGRVALGPYAPRRM